jgi:hypothetical protein
MPVRTEGSNTPKRRMEIGFPISLPLDIEAEASPCLIWLHA